MSLFLPQGDPSKKNCLILTTGSVATIKLPELAYNLSQTFNILIVCSSSSLHFLKQAKEYNEEYWKKFEEIGGYSLIYTDVDEWLAWKSSSKNEEVEREEEEEEIKKRFPNNHLIGYYHRKNNKISSICPSSYVSCPSSSSSSYVLHIELRKWADLALVAPLSANSLSILASGGSSNLLTSILRAWEFQKVPSNSPPISYLIHKKNIKRDENSSLILYPYSSSSSISFSSSTSTFSSDFFTSLSSSSSSSSLLYFPIKPIFICPAMNTFMWEHPSTFSHLQSLLSFGYQLILPIKKILACKEEGDGAMEKVDEIVNLILYSLLNYNNFVNNLLNIKKKEEVDQKIVQNNQQNIEQNIQQKVEDDDEDDDDQNKIKKIKLDE